MNGAEIVEVRSQNAANGEWGQEYLPKRSMLGDKLALACFPLALWRASISLKGY